MNVKNYTSSVDAHISMAKIEKMLVEIGASNINKKYSDKICTGITFLYHDTIINQSLAFNLKAQTDECFNILWKEIKRPRSDTKYQTTLQANRTAWKILSDWVEIQVSMILLGQAKPLQMFLPFVYDVAKDETLYDKVINGQGKILLGYIQP